MASLDGFNANDVAPTEGFDILPAGEYRVCIVESDRAKTKAGTGEILKLTLQVLDGQFQNRKVFEHINFSNPNAEAQRIGRGTLSAICRAVGVMTPGDTGDLHNRPMKVRLKVRQGQGQYGPQNEVVKYSADGPVAAPQQAAPNQAAPQQTVAAGPQSVWAQ